MMMRMRMKEPFAATNYITLYNPLCLHHLLFRMDTRNDDRFEGKRHIFVQGS
jgi:hypothetical protein